MGLGLIDVAFTSINLSFFFFFSFVETRLQLKSSESLPRKLCSKGQRAPWEEQQRRKFSYVFGNGHPNQFSLSLSGQ